MRQNMLYWLAAGAFLVGTSELVIAGILDQIAADLHISLASAGQLVTIYSLVFAICSPILILVFARTERFKLLLLSLLVFVLGSLVALCSPGYLGFMISRAILASSAGIYTVVSLEVAAKFAPPEKKGSAVSFILLGTSASMVFGVPLGVFVAQLWGWRSIFLGITILVLVVLLMLRVSFKASAAQMQERGNGERDPLLKLSQSGRWKALFQKRTLASLLVSLLWIAGYSIVYTYISPYLQSKSQMEAGNIGIALLVFGLFGLVGTHIGGLAADRWGVRHTLKCSIVVHAIALLGLFLLGQHQLAAWLLLPLWSASAWMMLPALQLHFATLDVRHADFMISMNSSTIHLGIAVGAALGGILIQVLPLASIGWIGALIVGSSLLPLLLVLNKGEPVAGQTDQIDQPY